MLAAEQRFARDPRPAVMREGAFYADEPRGLNTLIQYLKSKYCPDADQLEHEPEAVDETPVLFKEFRQDLKDNAEKRTIHVMALRGPEAFEEKLEAIDPAFHRLLQEMYKTDCSCDGASNTIIEAVKRCCMSCYAKHFHQAYVLLDEIAAETGATDDHTFESQRLLPSLRRRLGAAADLVELAFMAASNQQGEAARPTAERYSDNDAKYFKASNYAASVHNPGLWALHQNEITPEYAADLEVAHQADCTCRRKTRTLEDAVQAGCLRCCARLLWQARSRYRCQTALTEAVRQPDIRIVKLLAHSQTEAQFCGGMTALMTAAEVGNMQAIELLVVEQAKLQRGGNETALMLAVKSNHMQAVQYLLPLEAGVQDRMGKTALMHALLNNRPEAARLLFAYEKDIKDCHGRSAEEYAFRTRDVGIWRLFCPDITLEEGTEKHDQALRWCICEYPASALADAARNGCFSCCLKYRDQVGRFVFGWTAMMEAAERGNIDIVELLVDAEARMQTQNGRTALTLAVLNGRLDVVKLLMPLEKHLQLAHCSLLTQAVRSKNEPTLEYVLKETDPALYEHLQSARRASCVCGGESHQLVEAAERGCPRCAAKFISDVEKAGSSVSMRLAARHGHAEVVKFLIPFRARRLGKNGTTALMEAAADGRAEMVKLLLPHEAGATSTRHPPALIQAITQGQKECFDLLRQNAEECQYSGFHPYMRALCDGDLRAALEERDRWAGIFDYQLNILEIAIFAGRKTFARVLVGDPDTRQRLARSDAETMKSDNSMVLRYLSTPQKQESFRHLLGVICAADATARSGLLSKALFQYPGPAARLLRPFCNPTASDLSNVVVNARHKEDIAGGLRAMKNVGVLGSVEDLPVRHPSLLSEANDYLTTNPLRRRQVARPRPEEQSHPKELMVYDDFEEVPAERVFAQRDTEAESAFNRSLVLDSRGLWRKMLPVPRSCLVRAPPKPLAHKLARVAVMYQGAYFYACKKLQEGLDE